MAISGLPRVRTELDPLLIIPSLAHHPVQTNCPPTRHGDLGDLPSPAHHQVKVSAAPFRKTAHRYLCCFHQQEAQDRTALLGDVSQTSSIPAGVFQRNQTEVAGHLLATLKTFGFSDDQHKRQCGKRTHTRMGRQSLRLGKLLHFPLHRLAQLRDGWVQPIQQLQQVVPSPAGPRSQRERFQARTFRTPQPLLTSQPFVQRYRLQLIHDPRTRLHHAVAMPQQLPQVTVLPARHPDARKVILQHQLQDELGILPIGLLLPYPLGFDLGGISDPQLDLQLTHQPLEPAPVPTGFHSDTHGLSLAHQSAVERFGFVRMMQSSLLLSCLSWKWRKRSSVKITERTYEEGTEALHPRRKSSHPETASCGQSAGLGAE